MKANLIRLGAAITLLMAVLVPSYAQSEDWEPTPVWPFLYRRFNIATVETGIFKKSETNVPCNLHVGKGALWFSKDNETLMEAVPDNIRKVVFDNGDVYMPIGNNNLFGKVLYDGELQGKPARVFLLKKVNQAGVDQQFLDYINKTQNVLQGSTNGFFAHIADANSGEKPENMPVPLEYHFYYFFNGELFEATTKNILAHIKPERKKEYRAYTRSAEVLSTDQKSMLGVWNDFFINYEKMPKKRYGK